MFKELYNLTYITKDIHFKLKNELDYNIFNLLCLLIRKRHHR